MGRTGKRICAVIMLLFFLPGLHLHAGAMETAESCIQNMISYYFHYRDQAAGEINDQLDRLAQIDPGQAETWREIMDRWAWNNEEMQLHRDVLPDGLPADDSLCIVVLGYGLEDDGSMKPELVQRLEAAWASAEKYPEAYVLCTGGETANVPGISEAGQMAAWLLDQGMREGRIIVEDDSLSTTENAVNCCRLLWRDYPQITSLAIVSSDYHIRWGCTCFTTMTAWGTGYQGKPELTLVSNAACATEKGDADSMYSQAWGVSIIAGVPFDSTVVPALYMPEETVPAQTEAIALPASEPIAKEAAAEEPVIPVLLGLAAVVVFILIPKRRRK